jgi:hypothetical protein
MLIRFVGTQEGFNSVFPKIKWKPGELKEVKEDIGKELIKNPDFIRADKKVKREEVDKNEVYR